MALHTRQQWLDNDSCDLEDHSGNTDFHSELDGGGGQLHAAAALPPIPLNRRLDWPRSRCGYLGDEKTLCSCPDSMRDTTVICTEV
jgi:hypothetical protein